MKTRTYPAMMAILVGVASLSTSQASVIAYFCDGNDNDAAALTNQVTPSGVTVTTLSVIGLNDGDENITRTSFDNGGPALTTPAGPTASSAAGSQWLAARSNWAGNLVTPPISTDDYFGFTITANVGNTLSLNTFKFDMAQMDTDATATTPKAALMVSVNGGSFTLFGTPLSLSQTAIGVSAVTTQTIDLSSITGADNVEFRLNVSDNRGVSSAAYVFQGLQLDAMVIPEPTTMGLLLGGVGLLAARRKRM